MEFYHFNWTVYLNPGPYLVPKAYRVRYTSLNKIAIGQLV